MNPLSGIRLVCSLATVLCIVGCGDDNRIEPREIRYAIASTSDVQHQVDPLVQNPFIRGVRLTGTSLASLISLSYVINPKPGAVSKPVQVSYSLEALQRRGYFVTPGEMLLPVFGLYSGHTNLVRLRLDYSDGSAQFIWLNIATAPYSDPNGVFDRPHVIAQRQAGRSIGFDFFVLKTRLGGPVVIDSDAEIRWIGTAVPSSLVSAFVDNGFVIGSETSSQLRRLELDGTSSPITAPDARYTRFHHNFDPGRNGLLAEMDTPTDVESVIVEVSSALEFVKEWDLAEIFASFMSAHGDDPASFVRRGIDWFHSNAAAYRASDDTLLVSSRESFLVGLDYDSGEIGWIFGDPGKYWYQIPSLRTKALLIEGTGRYPIGQHAVSVTKDDLLLVFNNGHPSLNQPSGAPIGDTRPYSLVSAYRLDLTNRTATEVWSFDYDQTIKSAICSSAYQASDGSLLVTYSVANGSTQTRLVGLDAQRGVVFDFQYPATGCNTAWNSIPVPFDDIRMK